MLYRKKTTPSSVTGSIGITIGAILALFAFIVAVSEPGLAVSVSVLTIVLTVAVQQSLAVLARRYGDEIRELPVPGVGTVRFRVLS